MSKSNWILILGFMALASAGAANAGGRDDGKGDGKDGREDRPTPSRAVTWEELLDRCQHPQNYDTQVPPHNIKIQCSDVQREYVASAPGELPLPAIRNVVSAVFSDKFHVAAGEQAYALKGKGGSCLRFKEVEKTLRIEKPLGCEEALGIKGSVQDYCASVLDLHKGGNPKLVEVKETGNVIDTCGSSK
jgi:hypothetical protein